MFVQIIRGRTSDPEGLAGRAESWNAELRPGADGFLGSTGGVTADGDVVIAARFRDPAAARANSERPEQGAWWTETEKYFDSSPTFFDTTDVDTFGRGGSDDAGFVQVMEGETTDRARLSELDREFEGRMAELRPDLIGSLRAWNGNRYTEIAYFTSEAEARAGEANEMPDDMAAVFSEWEKVMGEVSFLDLTDPWLTPGRD